MRAKTVLALVVLIGLVTANEGGYTMAPYPVALSSSELIEKSFVYDNKNVTYVGEVVGPVMFRGEYAWINVYDGFYAIGVWCPKNYAKKIGFSGDYNHKGDIVNVSGTFHRACVNHGGDLDIHCDTLNIAQAGHDTKHPISRGKVYTTLFLGSAAIVLFMAEFRSMIKSKWEKLTGKR